MMPARDGDTGLDARGRPTTHEHRRDDATGDEFVCPVGGCWWNADAGTDRDDR